MLSWDIGLQSSAKTLGSLLEDFGETNQIDVVTSYQITNITKFQMWLKQGVDQYWLTNI